ncbi:reverse transcriptase family protein [Breznakiella homolactica]|uniref:RNA-directed DNA polymerase n=1 Tax=Breznakiella homolactica TaxID=2798577 RepID=A0A7T7XNI3_9SPIR|nr:reverse transcriptase family protein [Breznakiella homolactica]QQO09581.1 reverse transcriptase family protein [Breznakiella homolactica]
MRKVNKIYDITFSPLYGIKNKRKLRELLDIGTNEELIHLPLTNSYRIFSINGREIQEPIGLLRKIHDRLFRYLSRIDTPTYLYSGKRGLSYVDNAKRHINSSYFLKMDIKGFYKNANREYVFRFYRYRLNQSDDIAHILANISCYGKIIPTGSPISQLIAYWSYKQMFDEIAILNKDKIFTLYVDDLTISSVELSLAKNLHLQVQAIVKKYRLDLKRKKIRYYNKRENKHITGCVITSDHKFRVPNKHRKKLISIMRKYPSLNTIPEGELMKLTGLISSSQQIEPDIFINTKKRLSQIIKKQLA